VIGGLVLARQALVIAAATLVVIASPTCVAVVVQAVFVATKELRLVLALAALGIFQIRINLNLEQTNKKISFLFKSIR
jgi:hypothetical protein